jgi:ABC-type transporter Mla maintaining outer membrane lipid asymmetry ATPase subunit MlaF
MTGQPTSPPLIRIDGLVKAYQALRPLRIAAFTADRSDRIVLSGLDEHAAELFVYLVTGAAVPDEGTVSVGGHDTRGIATDTEWLSSLDRFGIVTHRAILLEGLTVAANLALPLTVAIDPLADDLRVRVEREAGDAGLAVDWLDRPAAELSPSERLRAHLARAAIVGPELVMLEHPTAALNQAGQSAAFGETLKALSASRGFGWIAISEDDTFAVASGGTRLRLNPATGKIDAGGRGWRKWLT